MSKTMMVGTRLPAELVRDLKTIEGAEQSDRSTTMRKLLHKAIQDWKLEHYAKLYGQGRMTLARASREAGVSLWEMMDHVRQHRITAQYDLDDLRQDLKLIQARSK